MSLPLNRLESRAAVHFFCSSANRLGLLNPAASMDRCCSIAAPVFPLRRSLPLEE
jgi:hypothetical protein